MDTKLCVKCGVVKEVALFGTSSRTRDGFRAMCRECTTEYERARYQKNAEERRKRAREYHYENLEKRHAYCKAYNARVRRDNPDVGKQYYQDHRDEIRATVKREADALKWETFIAYGGTCEFCGDTTFEYLQIDHVFGNPERSGNGARIAGPRLYRKLRRQGWPKKDYRLLCCNCNQTRQYYGDAIAISLGLKRKVLFAILAGLPLGSSNAKP